MFKSISGFFDIQNYGFYHTIKKKLVVIKNFLKNWYIFAFLTVKRFNVALVTILLVRLSNVSVCSRSPYSRHVFCSFETVLDWNLEVNKLSSWREYGPLMGGFLSFTGGRPAQQHAPSASGYWRNPRGGQTVQSYLCRLYSSRSQRRGH